MHVVSATDLMDRDWRFLAHHGDVPGVTWATHSGMPRNALERRVRRPHLGRYRAALSAVLEARRTPGALLVSHLPLMGAAVNALRRGLCPDVPQVGFSFSFTELPEGRRRRALSRALRGITECVVFSRFEQALYSAHFDMDPDAFRFLPWAMDPPEAGPLNPTGLSGAYLCAIGGEGRDYRLLARVMRDLPRIAMVVVARPASVAGIDFPANVRVHVNLPAAQTWRIARDSRGLVIPLAGEDTACGHVTLVGAQLLGVPLAITRTRGVADYVDDANALVVPAGDARMLRLAVTALLDDPAGSQARAAAARERARRESDPRRWVAYLGEIGRRFGL